MKNPLIRTEKVRELLFNEEEYIREFAEAARISFTEFRDHYASALEEGDEEKLRRAGHKIKPSAQMLELDPLLEEYEQGKKLVIAERPPDERNGSVERMVKICNRIIEEIGALT